MRLHAALPEHERGMVQLWFAIGAIGFGATMLGATAVTLAVVRLLA